MRFPPRLAHLATRAVVAARVLPTYSQTHQLDEEIARPRVEAALKTPLHDDLLAATWAALLDGRKRLDEAGLLEKVATTLSERPLRPGRTVSEPTPGWSAFLVAIDVAAGIASDAARRVLETPEGQKRTRAGIAEVGAWLAKELTRGK